MRSTDYAAASGTAHAAEDHHEQRNDYRRSQEHPEDPETALAAPGRGVTMTIRHPCSVMPEGFSVPFRSARTLIT